MKKIILGIKVAKRIRVTVMYCSWGGVGSVVIIHSASMVTTGDQNISKIDELVELSK